MVQSLAMRTTRSAIEGRRKARQTESRLVRLFVQLRLDSGVAQRALAREADVSPASVSRFEAGLSHPNIEWLTRVATALGADLAVGLYANTGPPIRDRWQAPMIEALLRSLGTGWRAFLETPVTGHVRGLIDVLLVNATERIVVAVEAESELRRVEQELRWATQKADALPTSEWWIRTGLADLGVSRVARVLLLRSTRRNRTIVRELSSTFAAAYPAAQGDVVEALAGQRSWPGDGLVWVTFDGRTARLSRVRLA